MMPEQQKIYKKDYVVLLDRKKRVIWATGNIHAILADGYKPHGNLKCVILNPNHKYDNFGTYTLEDVKNMPKEDPSIKVVPWRETL